MLIYVLIYAYMCATTKRYREAMVALAAMGSVFVVGLGCSLFYAHQASNGLGVVFIALVGSSTIAMMSVSFDFAPELLFKEGSSVEGISSAILNIATNVIGGAMVFVFQALPSRDGATVGTNRQDRPDLTDASSPTQQWIRVFARPRRNSRIPEGCGVV